MTVTKARSLYAIAVKRGEGIDEARRMLTYAKLHRSAVEAADDGLRLTQDEFLDLFGVLR